ncbi:hypothetical protein EON63_00840 [archaeon]|nr:MAG: hypothetical protein EON63_00840 [archaeon]
MCILRLVYVWVCAYIYKCVILCICMCMCIHTWMPMTTQLIYKPSQNTKGTIVQLDLLINITDFPPRHPCMVYVLHVRVCMYSKCMCMC